MMAYLIFIVPRSAAMRTAWWSDGAYLLGSRHGGHCAVTASPKEHVCSEDGKTAQRRPPRDVGLGSLFSASRRSRAESGCRCVTSRVRAAPIDFEQRDVTSSAEAKCHMVRQSAAERSRRN